MPPQVLPMLKRFSSNNTGVALRVISKKSPFRLCFTAPGQGNGRAAAARAYDPGAAQLRRSSRAGITSKSAEHTEQQTLPPLKHPGVQPYIR